MKAIDQFVRSRAEEGTAEYLRLYDAAFERVVRLFELTDNLAALTTDILDSRSGMREIARYLTAPPVSDDDLKTLAGFGSTADPAYLAEMLKSDHVQSRSQALPMAVRQHQEANGR